VERAKSPLPVVVRAVVLVVAVVVPGISAVAPVAVVAPFLGALAIVAPVAVIHSILATAETKRGRNQQANREAMK
jgi:hypothetical protein